MPVRYFHPRNDYLRFERVLCAQWKSPSHGFNVSVLLPVGGMNYVSCLTRSMCRDIRPGFSRTFLPVAHRTLGLVLRGTLSPYRCLRRSLRWRCGAVPMPPEPRWLRCEQRKMNVRTMTFHI